MISMNSKHDEPPTLSTTIVQIGAKNEEHYKVQKYSKNMSEKLYQKPAGNILVVLFRHIDILVTENKNLKMPSSRLFEDVPSQLFILVTSKCSTENHLHSPISHDYDRSWGVSMRHKSASGSYRCLCGW
jgi:hypothetical protein